jgi:hypothetical protein
VGKIPGARGRPGSGPARQAIKTSRVHGTIERTAGMLGVRSAARCSRVSAYRSPALLFNCAGSVRFTDPQRIEHLTGTGNSKRPFARSQRRFRHHCEVDAPGLPLRFRAKELPKPVRSRTPPLRAGFEKPPQGEISALHPLPEPISSAPVTSPVSTPLQVF